MQLTNDQIHTIETSATRAADYDLAALASDAKASPTARAMLCGQHQPCGECGEPIHDPAMVAAQALRVDTYPGPAPADEPVTPRAHADCDDPEIGTVGPAEGYMPASRLDSNVASAGIDR